MIYISRKETFCAAHKLSRKEWDETKNKEVFGACSNPNWHGHNFELTITLKGKPNKDTGFVVNLKEVGKIMQEKVISKVDHKNLNLDVDFMKNIMPSTENFAIGIWEQLYEPIFKLGAELHCVKLVETNKNEVRYYGELDTYL